MSNELADVQNAVAEINRVETGLAYAIGKKFGRLTVLSEGGRDKKKNILWQCRCDCGADVEKPRGRIINGDTRSCGCLKADTIKAVHTTHGHAPLGRKSKTYMVWASMIQRCHTPTNRAFPDYGGRGIEVFPAWRVSFDAFLSYVGEKPAGKWIDRIDNDGNYEPGNVEWATPLRQASHTRKTVYVVCDGVRVSLAQFARDNSLKYDTARYHINRGDRTLAGKTIQVIRRVA